METNQQCVFEQCKWKYTCDFWFTYLY